MKFQVAQKAIRLNAPFEVRTSNGEFQFAGPAIITSFNDGALVVDVEGEPAGVFSRPWSITMDGR